MCISGLRGITGQCSECLDLISRSVAQPGSASGLGPEGRRFESCRSDHQGSFLKQVDGKYVRKNFQTRKNRYAVWQSQDRWLGFGV